MTLEDASAAGGDLEKRISIGKTHWVLSFQRWRDKIGIAERAAVLFEESLRLAPGEAAQAYDVWKLLWSEETTARFHAEWQSVAPLHERMQAIGVLAIKYALMEAGLTHWDWEAHSLSGDYAFEVFASADNQPEAEQMNRARGGQSTAA